MWTILMNVNFILGYLEMLHNIFINLQLKFPSFLFYTNTKGAGYLNDNYLSYYYCTTMWTINEQFLLILPSSNYLYNKDPTVLKREVNSLASE